MNHPTVKFIFSILIAQLAGVIGSLFTASTVSTWYAGLAKPTFNPPGWVFGPVWFVLYTFIGVALYLIWRRGLDKKHTRFVFSFFIVHLVINTLWSIVFFGLQNILMALIVIVVLWCMILGLILWSWKINRWASYLLIPYLAWVSFATLLNFSIWKLNM